MSIYLLTRPIVKIQLLIDRYQFLDSLTPTTVTSITPYLLLKREERRRKSGLRSLYSSISKVSPNRQKLRPSRDSGRTISNTREGDTGKDTIRGISYVTSFPVSGCVYFYPTGSTLFCRYGCCQTGVIVYN